MIFPSIFALAINTQRSTSASKFKKRAVSSVGSEHLVYTEGVGSSSLSPPTKRGVHANVLPFFFPYTPVKKEPSRSKLGRLISAGCS